VFQSTRPQGARRLSPGSAKNLLKNKTLQDGRERDLEAIIEGLR